MTHKPADPYSALVAANPFLAFWAMPWLMAGVWTSGCLAATARTDALKRNPDPGQVPVPPVLQDSKDENLFA